MSINIERKNISKWVLYHLLMILYLFLSCANSEAKQQQKQVKTGADNIEVYLPLLKDKKVAVVTNQTGIVRVFNEDDSIIEKKHLIDFLLQKGIEVKAVFAPEHGFRGGADAGEHIKDAKDSKTSLPVYSLHGKFKKPQLSQLRGIDLVVFDIQDVGVRFYTYISTLHYVLEACAENNIQVVVLDRPNPNGHYVDGPVLNLKYKSFVGMHPIPVVYGMTIGEVAQMIVGEKWLSTLNLCNLVVVPLQNWTHSTVYSLPIKPSPNLPNDRAISLYPSLCFFEQTTVSVGRGTDKPFQIYGSPFLDTLTYRYKFKPRSVSGAKYPKHKGKWCYGEDLSKKIAPMKHLDIKWLVKAYQNSSEKEKFFKKRFEYLSGTENLRKQIEEGCTVQEIKDNWKDNVLEFKKIRKKYLLYSDFK